MFTRESELLKNLKVTRRTGMVKFASVPFSGAGSDDEEKEIDSAPAAKRVLRKFKKSPDVPKGYVDTHEKRLTKGEKPKKVVTDFFEGLQDVKKSCKSLNVVTAKLFRQHGIFKTADRNVYQDLATGDFWKISEDKKNVVRMFKEVDGISDRVSDRHSVMQKAAANIKLKKGDKVKFVNVEDVSEGDWGDVVDYQKFLSHEGQTATIESIEVENSETNSEMNYYDIKFVDGFVVPACSGYHLELVKSASKTALKKDEEAYGTEEWKPSTREEAYFQQKEIERRKQKQQQHGMQQTTGVEEDAYEFAASKKKAQLKKDVRPLAVQFNSTKIAGLHGVSVWVENKKVAKGILDEDNSMKVYNSLVDKIVELVKKSQ